MGTFSTLFLQVYSRYLPKISFVGIFVLWNVYFDRTKSGDRNKNGLFLKLWYFPSFQVEMNYPMKWNILEMSCYIEQKNRRKI